MLFLAAASLIHVTLLMAWSWRLPMASNAVGSLGVTLLAPQQPALAQHQQSMRTRSVRTAAMDKPASDTGNPVSAPALPVRGASDATETQQPATTSNKSRQAEAEIRGRMMQQHLDRALRASFYYPLIAQRQGWQGEVRIALTIQADGTLANIRVSRSSGYAILDDAAVDSVRRIRAIPEAIASLAGENLDLVLPVRYELRSG